MAAQTSPLPRFDRRARLIAVDEPIPGVLARIRPKLDEVLSLWPAERRGQLVLWAQLDARGETAVGARFREHAADRGWRDLVTALGRIRDDVPVVLELEEGRAIVLPLSHLPSDASHLPRVRTLTRVR